MAVMLRLEALAAARMLAPPKSIVRRESLNMGYSPPVEYGNSNFELIIDLI
jgi:hypothetical protein